MRDFPERKLFSSGQWRSGLGGVHGCRSSQSRQDSGSFYSRCHTPANHGFFDSAMGPLSGDRARGRNNRSVPQYGDNPTSVASDMLERRPVLPPRTYSETPYQTSDGPAMGKLIDFDDEPQEAVHESHRRVMPRSASAFEALDSPRRKSASEGNGKVPLPGLPNRWHFANKQSKHTGSISEGPAASNKENPPPPPKPRRPNAQQDSLHTHPLSQTQSSADLKTPSVPMRIPVRLCFKCSTNSFCDLQFSS